MSVSVCFVLLGFIGASHRWAGEYGLATAFPGFLTEPSGADMTRTEREGLARIGDVDVSQMTLSKRPLLKGISSKWKYRYV